MKKTRAVVAKKIVLGYKLCGYLPVAMAQPVFDYCYGVETPETELVKKLLETIPQHEKAILTQNIESIIDSEEFEDVLEALMSKCESQYKTGREPSMN